MASKDICRIDAHINSLCELQLDPDLISLNLHCNNIQRIENLNSLGHLKHLDLSSNHIERIVGLDRLVSLRTLNLSCNQIQVVDGLVHLRNLTKLDLSYNMIDNLSGLKALHGTSHNLTYLYLHGNHLTSLDHILNCLRGCAKLKELTLAQHGEGNPVCVVPGYRSSLLTAMTRLEVLDGSDRAGMPAAVLEGVHDVPGLDDYMAYLMSTDSSEQSQAESRYEVVTPRIDLVLNRYKHHKPFSSDTDQDRDDDTVVQKTGQDPKQPAAHVRLSADHEVRLETLEHQIANLLYKPETQKVRTIKQPGKVSKGAGSNSEESDTNEVPEATTRKRAAPKSPKTRRAQKPGKTTLSRKQRPKPSTKPSATTESSSSTSPSTPGLIVKGKVVGRQAVRAPEDDASFLSLMQELDTERERRWKAEQAGRKLVDHIKEIHSKAKRDKQLQEAALAASARLKQALLKERETKTAVQREATELQTQNKDLSEQLKKSTETEQEQRKALQAMEEAAAKLDTRRIQEHAQEVAQTQEHKMREAAACRETELLKHSVKQLKGQVHQLQELLASREQEHRKEKEGLVRSDSKEVRDLLEKELIKQEARQEQVVRQYQDRLEKRNTDYAALEDEFRMALQIEANRFRELQEAFERVSEESAENKQALSSVTQKEKKASSMVTELTAMVKEQRGRITELSRSRQDQMGEYKERIQSLEKQLSDTRRQLTRLEVLEQDKSKLAAQIRAQESVIEGLRTERKLWSQELAQQGASLAQDRGRLEARIESLTAEVQELRKQSQSDNDTIRIKTKLVEDQTDSIRNLKKALLEREKEAKSFREEREGKEKELQDQLAAETATNQEQQEQIDGLVERKEQLKKQLRDVQEQLDSTNEAHRALKSKWQEKSELISRMEREVVQMRDNFVAKETKLTEERDKAIAAGNAAIEKLKACDDAFRQQLEQQSEEHRREMERTGHEKDREIEQANARVLEVEGEMRELLQENALTKKTLEIRIKKLTSAFHEIQQDLAT